MLLHMRLSLAATWGQRGQTPSGSDPKNRAWPRTGPGPGLGSRLFEGIQLAPELLALVAQLGCILEAQLLGCDVHLLLERDDELLELLARHALDLLRAAPPPSWDMRRLEREELGDVGDALRDRL